MSMSPFVALILNLLLSELEKNATSIIESIKAHFPATSTDATLQNALQNLAYSPSLENLEALYAAFELKGESTEKLAKIIVAGPAGLPVDTAPVEVNAAQAAPITDPIKSE